MIFFFSPSFAPFVRPSFCLFFSQKKTRTQSTQLKPIEPDGTRPRTEYNISVVCCINHPSQENSSDPPIQPKRTRDKTDTYIHTYIIIIIMAHVLSAVEGAQQKHPAIGWLVHATVHVKRNRARDRDRETRPNRARECDCTSDRRPSRARCDGCDGFAAFVVLSFSCLAIVVLLFSSF